LLLAPRWGVAGTLLQLSLAPELQGLVARSSAVVDLLYRAALGLGFAVNLLLAQPDFARRPVRLLAQVERQLQSASAYFLAGKAYARREMWATAVVHWQRAAANDPLRAGYQEALGEGYARLGFFARGQDALQSALRLTAIPEQQQRIASRLAAVAAEASAAQD
jgi:tetratricopeptide (TPR) repeat protein